MGRPVGTTAAEGYSVSMDHGRPVGATATEGYSVSSGRLVGITAAYALSNLLVG